VSPLPQAPFYFARSGVKVTCRVCGRTGYGLEDPSPGYTAPWQAACLGGHDHHCTCGRSFSGGGALGSHISAHRRHGDPNHAKKESP
jgi:hypothetical protein